MGDEITIKDITEAGIVFAMTMVFLVPYMYWMIRVKLRTPSHRRTWALLSTASLFLGTGLIFAALFGSARNAILPSVLAYPFFTAWKGVTILCVDIIELIQVVDPLIYAYFSRAVEPDPSIKARIIILGLTLIFHLPFIGATVWLLGLSGVEYCLSSQPQIKDYRGSEQ
ncbi:hypothetical protein HIM_10854 [Hirsutella minnesotensis 3608]|uniref:Uncharacterized protein n=1 Tax=Hirsutella minnesotensis 3608 TaxID=1043627 RepID=A0A0F7ZRJ9_9HYPO|nr:hypothetical protein HIM_10854 [Hirsutella minnesotensis 3608]